MYRRRKRGWTMSRRALRDVHDNMKYMIMMMDDVDAEDIVTK